jgi:hypothetical protein
MTMTDTDTAVLHAARRLVGGFSAIPHEWASLVAQHIDEEECCALPMWGTLFKVEDSCDERGIRKMLQPIGVSTSDDITDIRDFIEDKGLDVDPDDHLWGEPEDGDYDLEMVVDAVNEAWRDSYDEDCHLADSGWQRVGDTGILAREFDGNILLGINGAGYDFYESHWTPLYLALGYKWHK